MKQQSTKPMYVAKGIVSILYVLLFPGSGKREMPLIHLTDESLLKFGRQETRHLQCITVGTCAITASGLVDFALNWLEKTDPQATWVQVWISDDEKADLRVALSFADIQFDRDDVLFTIKRGEEDDSPKLVITVW